MPDTDLQHLIRLLSRLPGLGPRSGRRLALHLIKKREQLLLPLLEALRATAENVRTCGVCGNLDTRDPCSICADPRRDDHILCVVEDVADLWALERSGAFRGTYHILGGVLSALDGITPEDLHIERLLRRCSGGGVAEVILAMNATVDGQTTAHYVASRLQALGQNIRVTGLAHGVPMGGELDYLDEGTLTTALASRGVL
jgi:recombination protein RecR